MKYVYLVQERTLTDENDNKQYNGVAYYSSYKKALKDFNKRMELYEKYELVDKFDIVDSLTTHIRLFKMKDNYYKNIVLLKHNVY